MKKKDLIKLILIVLAALGAGLCSFGIEAEAHPDGPLVIVLDPGHGGENEGAKYDGYIEKEMTMIVARAMKEELEKYDNVEVYLTRQGDADMTIKDRAAFAKEKNADFLFCLHFNSSIHHTLYGTELWVPADGTYYAKGYSFAQIGLQELTSLGLYSRGIKTRLNDRGENYYGILRYCTYEGIPSVLIEHCHLDQEKDEKFYRQGEDQLKELGRLDATAAAKYFQLKSEILGVDYSDYPVPETEIPSDTVRPDKTEPELCRIEMTTMDEATGEVSVHMEAEDKDSYILYYCYSTDGGNTYSPLEEWPRPDVWHQSSKSHDFTLTIPLDEEIELRAAAYNGFDLLTESNIITLDPIIDKESEKAEKALAEMQKEMPEKTPNGGLLTGDDSGENGNDGGTRDGGVENGSDGGTRDVASGEKASGDSNGGGEATGDIGQEEENRPSAFLLGSMIAGIMICIVFLSFFMAKMIVLLLKGNKKQ